MRQVGMFLDFCCITGDDFLLVKTNKGRGIKRFDTFEKLVTYYLLLFCLDTKSNKKSQEKKDVQPVFFISPDVAFVLL
jgi:hypothetical protein